jgi:hypothetical protein
VADNAGCVSCLDEKSTGTLNAVGKNDAAGKSKASPPEGKFNPTAGCSGRERVCDRTLRLSEGAFIDSVDFKLVEIDAALKEVMIDIFREQGLKKRRVCIVKGDSQEGKSESEIQLVKESGTLLGWLTSPANGRDRNRRLSVCMCWLFYMRPEMKQRCNAR